MGQRRTKEQKIIAQLRRKLEEIKPADLAAKVEHWQNRTYVNPNLTLPVKEIRKDLLRTVMVLIGALMLQVVLAQYLQHGGWDVVKRLLVF